MSEDTHSDTHTVPTEGEETVVGGSQELQEADVLKQINEGIGGGTYKDLSAAIEGFKEARSAIGRYGAEAGAAKKEAQELAEKIADPNSFVSKEQYEKDMFLTKNPEYEPYKDIISSRAKELDVPMHEVIEKDEPLKNTLEKLRKHDDTEEAKSVLMTNPRLGQATDKMKVAAEALKEGDHVSASQNAVAAVMDAYSK